MSTPEPSFETAGDTSRSAGTTRRLAARGGSGTPATGSRPASTPTGPQPAASQYQRRSVAGSSTSAGSAKTGPGVPPAGGPAATATTGALVRAAAALVRAIGDQAARDQESFAAGFEYAARLFFDHGVEVGRARAHQLLDAEWARLAAELSPIAQSPAHAELERRRYPHHTPERLAELRRQARRRFGLIPPDPKQLITRTPEGNDHA